MDNKDFSLSDEQVAFYRSSGFLVVDDLFSSEECDRAIASYKKYAKPDFGVVTNFERGYIEYYEEDEEFPDIVVVEKPDVKVIRSMLRHPHLVRMLDTLQSAETVLLQSAFLFKEAGSSYANQAWNPHQDNAYPLADYGMYITANFPFADQDPENGGMYIYPGSHVEPILPNIKVKSSHESPGTNPGHCVEVPEKYILQKTDLYLKKGSVLFLHGNVIHGSYPNHSLRSRPMLLVPYGTKGITKGKNFLSGKRGKRIETSIR